MSNDPFAAVPTDETNQDLANNTNTTPTQKESIVTNTIQTQAKIVATLKGGSGYDAPWIVVHADTPEEAAAALKDPAMKELLELTQNVGSKFVGMAPAKAAPAQSTAAPAAATAAPGGQTPPEGYVFKSGMGKGGKMWKAFMPIDRNSGLPVQWL